MATRRKTTAKRGGRDRAAKDQMAASTPALPYQPSPREQAALEAQKERVERSKPAPRIKVTDDEGANIITPDHPDLGLGTSLLMEAMGTADPDFLIGFTKQLARASSGKEAMDEEALNFMLAVVKGIEPQDQIEAMLAAQMAAVHSAVMTFTRRLACVETLAQQDSAERTLNKLARTYAAQMEALKRYRTGGEQKVTVEHVTVNEGGQAIVGNVSGGRGGVRKQESTA
jgi:hypothetical protein